MSKRAEEAALKAYPINIQATQLYGDWDINKTERNGFVKGYEAAQKELGWISVKERLPEKDGLYFTCQDIKGEPRSVMTMLFDNGKWYDGGGYRRRIIDYWMPIPEFKED